jgi:hypothetical protein
VCKQQLARLMCKSSVLQKAVIPASASHTASADARVDFTAVSLSGVNDEPVITEVSEGSAAEAAGVSGSTLCATSTSKLQNSSL